MDLDSLKYPIVKSYDGYKYSIGVQFNPIRCSIPTWDIYLFSLQHFLGWNTVKKSFAILECKILLILWDLHKILSVWEDEDTDVLKPGRRQSIGESNQGLHDM